jgi:hypothetical protein
MALRRTLELSDSQRQDLVHYRNHDPHPFVRERCAAIVKIVDGQSAQCGGTPWLAKAARPGYPVYSQIVRASEGHAGL